MRSTTVLLLSLLPVAALVPQTVKAAIRVGGPRGVAVAPTMRAEGAADGERPAPMLRAGGLLATATMGAPIAAEAPARALLSWANAPYLAGAGFAGYRAYKAVQGVRADQRASIDAFGAKLVLGPKQNRKQFENAAAVYRKKLLYLPRDGALLASGLAAVAAKPASVASLRAFDDLLAVFGLAGPAAASALEAAFDARVSRTSERGKLLFYASRSGVATDGLRTLAAEGLDGSLEFLAASQAGMAEQAYASALKKATKAGPPYAADSAAAAALGLDAAAADRVLGDLNRVPDADADKADWLKDLEATVEAESGPLPGAADVDTTDKFAPKEEEEMMLTCECQECGYTLFIAQGREGKFFSDAFKCPTCGAPKSKFTIDDANASA